MVVRKRPLLPKETQSGELDIITNSEQAIRVHECKVKVDGISKYIINSDFEADRCFSHQEKTENVYQYTFHESLKELIKSTEQKASKEESILTCFAFGQTSSGKTFTMQGISKLASKQLFSTSQSLEIGMSSYEIFGGKPLDLLNKREKVHMMEDAQSRIQIQNLSEHPVTSAQELV